MKKIGLIGGMSWESSKEYYEIINERVKELLGGYHSAKCILESVDFSEIQKFQKKEDWEKLGKIMAQSAKNLENGGAEFIILCTNTMHLLSKNIKENIHIPFIHIADATGKEIISKKLTKVALLGTMFTMEKDFYKKKLLADYGVEVIIPEKEDRLLVHNIIYKELIQGDFKETSKNNFVTIINKLKQKGAQGVILGCTEIPLLVKQSDVDIPVFDTTKIHAHSAVEFALKQVTYKSN